MCISNIYRHIYMIIYMCMSRQHVVEQVLRVQG